MRLLAPLICLTLFACPPPTPVVDAGPEDSGFFDAGHDAGRPPRPDAGTDAGWVNVPIAQWCVSNATARCWRDIRCGRIDSSLLENCVADKSLTCDSSAYVRSNAEGRHLYDVATAVRCLNAFDTGSCEDTPAACASVFAGKTPPDAGCFVPEDCDPAAGFCDTYDDLCPHHCSPWAQAGQNCSGSFAPRCQPGVTACEYPDSGTFQRICQPPHQAGETCDSFDSCALGTVCSGGKCQQQYADAGEACGVTNGFPYCTGELFCRQTAVAMGTPDPGTCERRAGVGGVCHGYGSCLPSLRCSSSIGTGKCLKRAAIGEPCSTFGECQDGLYCANQNSRCAPLPKDGGDCSPSGSYYECAPGYYCDFTTTTYSCRALARDGETCSYNGTCLSNECQYGLWPDAGYGFRCVRCSQADAGT